MRLSDIYDKTPKEKTQKLWDYLHKKYGITMMGSDMYELFLLAFPEPDTLISISAIGQFLKQEFEAKLKLSELTDILVKTIETFMPEQWKNDSDAPLSGQKVAQEVFTKETEIILLQD